MKTTEKAIEVDGLRLGAPELVTPAPLFPALTSLLQMPPRSRHQRDPRPGPDAPRGRRPRAGPGDDNPLITRILVGVAIGGIAVLIGDAIRRERERTVQTQEAARRVAELRDRDVERAVVEERLRIVRDVHDITGHHLSAISLQAAGGGRTTADPVARATLERIHRLSSEALGQTRRALGVLREVDPAHPAVVEPPSRLAHVDRLLVPARDAGLEVDLCVDGADRPLPDEIEVCAYRVVQESLTNVVRHAGARAVRVHVAYGERELLLTIEDDGVGGPGRAGGGIAGMRERVAIVGGSITAGPIGADRAGVTLQAGRPAGSSRPGWSVRASLPLAAEPDDGDRGAVPSVPGVAS